MKLRTLDSTKQLWEGKRVLLRVDWNVPIQNGHPADLSRIQETLPTIRQLLEAHCQIILMTHLGRPVASIDPKDWDPNFSIQILRQSAEKVIGEHILVDSSTSQDISFNDHFQSASLVLLNNLRFHPGEEANDPTFAQDLARLGDFYVNDAFSASHRAHASIVGIPSYLPSAAGICLEKEVKALISVLQDPIRPFSGIIGGAKISTKLSVISNLLPKLDYLMIGGAMAHTFLKAQGYEIGASMIEEALVPTAQAILTSNPEKIILPVDARGTLDGQIASWDWTACPLNGVAFDIGPKTRDQFAQILQKSQTIIWNGPVGRFEEDAFRDGTTSIAQWISALTQTGCRTIAGGGDTIHALNQAKISPSSFSHVSTAGGAFLEWLEGRSLPGVDALMGKLS